MQKVWAPPETTESLFARMEQGQRFAKAEDAITNKNLMRSCEDWFRETGVFNLALDKCRDKKSTVNTWVEFKTFWAMQDKNRRDNIWSGVAGYMASNAAWDAPTTIDAPTFDSIHSAATEPTIDSTVSTLTAATQTL